ncbi:hypothetical protein ONE63_008042 [Megalurothrips usitatus]|uniref:Uncharacterized protein n=1 Tax=Megalurothrips usitatus TaxID=439358 RepID=A0AAV7XW02_9NEOP|nr:hypothetical protein ONE63_008042 [Megalurothrips usitatus]
MSNLITFIPQDLDDLNDYVKYTSRDLKLKRAYQLLSIKYEEQHGVYGPYKTATAVFKDKSKESGTIKVKMPKPVADFSYKQIRKLKDRIKSKNYPLYTVHKISSRSRADGKGSYDIVDFKWA